MAKIKPFRGVRPVPEKAHLIASKPYDVLSAAEAREEAKGNPLSFLHVVKPEIDLPEDTDPYAEAVYEKGRSNFRAMVDEGLMVPDSDDALYVYQLDLDGRSQTGLVACAAVDDYYDDVILKHELTRPDKENDRKQHVLKGGMHAEPVFFAYRSVDAINKLTARVVKSDPVYDFTDGDGVRHRMWVVNDAATIRELVNAFAKVPHTYVADGHHRTAAAAKAGRELRDHDPQPASDKEYNWFLAVHFPADQLHILDYNRVVRDLNGLTGEEFLEKLKEDFEVIPHGNLEFRPFQPHQFGMYLDGQWYELDARNTPAAEDPVEHLDVTLLAVKILEPILAITDQRTDRRIDFVGGKRGLKALSDRVDSGEMRVAFALYPVSMEALMEISDRRQIMPPKTTWFEPKLKSGLIVHMLQ